jgi:hypothetical protein
MSPTLDETATTRDERVTVDHRAALAFGVLSRAIEFDGMPAPWGVCFIGDVADVQMLCNQIAGVDDWARRLGVTAELDNTIIHGGSGRMWRAYQVEGSLDGASVRVWSSVDVEPERIHLDLNRADELARCGYHLGDNGGDGWTTDPAKVTCSGCNGGTAWAA